MQVGRSRMIRYRQPAPAAQFGEQAEAVVGIGAAPALFIARCHQILNPES